MITAQVNCEYIQLTCKKMKPIYFYMYVYDFKMVDLLLFTGMVSLVTTYLHISNTTQLKINMSSISPTAELIKFSAAGVVFTNGKLILAGYNPNKKKPYISGIGGSKNQGETYYHTAIREMLEEMFEFYDITDDMIEQILTVIPPKKEHIIDRYVILVYTFKDLTILLNYLANINLKTHMYTQFPLTLDELLFERILYKKDADLKPEISHLCLLPVVNHDPKKHFVSLDLIYELPLYL